MNNRYFVFDSNALISANIKPGSVSAKAYEKARATGILMRTDETFDEFADRFILPKFERYLPLEERIEKIEEYRQDSIPVRVMKKIRVCRDADDDKFLELALAAGAHCIVSGDKALLELDPFGKTRILSASEFIDLF